MTEPEGPGTGSDDTYYAWPGPNVPPEWAKYRTVITSDGDWILFQKTE